MTQSVAIKISTGKTLDTTFHKLKSISRGKVFFEPKKVGTQQRTPRIMDADFFRTINWVNWRTQCSFDFPCCQCGSDNNVQMHHVRRIRGNKYSLIPPANIIQKLMSLRNRKQLPLCLKCHTAVHHQDMDVSHLKKQAVFIYDRLYDNRMVDIESKIHKGIDHVSLPYPYSFIEKGSLKWKPEYLRLKKHNIKPIYNY